MTLFACGLSHRTAPLEIREPLALDEDALRDVLRDLVATEVVGEAVILSTCNRVEVYGVAAVPGEARSAAFRCLCRRRGVDPASLEPLLYNHLEEDAVRHAFRVAASLDSMVVGEPQILGQVKDAFALAQSCQTVGPTLHTLFTQAFTVAKRVRTETEVGRHAVSVSFAAVELARKIFGGLQGRPVLLLGAGQMGELAARHLVEHGAFPIYVVNRTWTRAEDLARSLAGTAVPFEDMASALASVDIVIASTGAPAPLVTRESVARIMHARGARPLFFIDIAVPRDVEADVGQLEGVYCYDIDDLRQVVDANLRQRARAAERAETLVEREAARFVARLGDLEVVPTIVSLRERLEVIRAGEVRKALARLPEPSPITREAMEALSMAIVNKILHAPITKLRESSRAGAGRSWTELVQELFGLSGSASRKTDGGWSPRV
jgi:glutamyl-tRNA reductase